MLSAKLSYSVLQSAPDAIVIIDASGAIQFVNFQVCTLFGYTRDQLLESNVDLLLPERFRLRHAAHRAGYAGASRIRPMGTGLDLFARRKDGSEFPVEISLSPIQDGDKLLVAAAIRDVSDRKRADEALMQARAVADQANQAKSRFLATASHDLRQPLQSLALLNGSLRRLIPEGLALDALDQQSTAIDAMSRLLNSLLDIGKLESGAVKPQLGDFSLSALFSDLYGEYIEVAHSKGLELGFDANGLNAHSDVALVGQVLRNLVSNALKYTSQGGVRVQARHERDSICVTVRDTGIGIAPEQLNLIYDEFYQVGVNPNAVRDGYGLGLSIVQRLVRLLNVMIAVDSATGQGSTFTLMIPEGSSVISQHKASLAARPSARPANAQYHVLLVEDDPGVRNATRIFLSVEGFKVTALSSLEEAMAAAQGPSGIDIIVTDYHLGGNTTGTEVIASIRKLLRRDVKAVLVTGDTSAAMREIQTDQNLRLVRKPVNAEELAGILRHLLAP